jgi:hypothetical protein
MPSNKKLPRELLDLLGSYTSLAVGATAAVASEYPVIFDSVLPRPIRPRHVEGYEYLGYTVTRPDAGSVVLGLSYREREAGRHKEDLFRVDALTGEVGQFERGSFEAVDPRYKNTHHAPKSYFEG